MYLAQTNLVVDENKTATHKDGSVVLSITSESQPDKLWFVRKKDYDAFGRDCPIFRGQVDKSGVVDNFYHE